MNFTESQKRIILSHPVVTEDSEYTSNRSGDLKVICRRRCSSRKRQIIVLSCLSAQTVAKHAARVDSEYTTDRMDGQKGWTDEQTDER